MKSSPFRAVSQLSLCATVAMVCLTPIAYAKGTDVEIPPSINYASSLDNEEEKAKSVNIHENTPCRMCGNYETVALQKLLSQYQSLANNGGWPAWEEGKKLHVTQADARMPALRQILTITGDYKSASGVAANSPQFDTALEEAVKHFQARHGLNVDGTLSASTQAALAVPVEERIEQIQATLLRIQENPLPADSKFIVVNLPAYTLYGIDRGATAVTMRVIVGSRKNHTPLFDNEVTDVIFNPPWSVPARIARNEMLPKLRRNPSYFINANFQVTQNGVEVDPMSVDPSAGGLSFRQRPGTGNALGKIKFNIPDSDDIYLHSTSSPKLFQQEDRALSHGCIRLEKPRELAYFVMGQEQGWNTQKIDVAYDSNSQRRVPVTAVPVHLVYWTAFVDETGTAHFYKDMYGKDHGMLARAKEASAGTMVVAEK